MVAIHNKGTGTWAGGVIYDESGFIITNYHAIHNGERLELLVLDRVLEDVDILAIDTKRDLAILKIDMEGLPTVKLAELRPNEREYSNVYFGMEVVAFTNALKQWHSITHGIISQIRKSEYIENVSFHGGYELFQTDANTAPGSSGGGLLNMKGEVIGIVVAGMAPGFNFAIPINFAYPLLERARADSVIPIEKFPDLSNDSYYQQAFRTRDKEPRDILRSLPTGDLVPVARSYLEKMSVNLIWMMNRYRRIIYADREILNMKQRAQELIMIGDLKQANSALDEAISMDRNAIGNMEGSMRIYRLSLAQSYAMKGDLKMFQLSYLEAAECYRQACMRLPKNSDDYLADYKNKAGWALYKAGDYEQAELILKEWLSDAQEGASDAKPTQNLYGLSERADSNDTLALIYRDQGKYDRAKDHNRKALDARKKLFGEDSWIVAETYNSRGSLYYECEEYPEAMNSCKKALNIWKGLKHKTKNDELRLADIYSNLAVLHHIQDERDENIIEGYLNDALDIRKLYLDKRKKHPDMAESYNNLGVFYFSQGNYGLAGHNFKKALDIWVSILGSEHLTVANAHVNMGAAYYRQGRKEEALGYFRDAMVVLVDKLSSDHPMVIKTFWYLEQTYKSLNELGEIENIQKQLGEGRYSGYYGGPIEARMHVNPSLQRAGGFEDAREIQQTPKQEDKRFSDLWDFGGNADNWLPQNSEYWKVILEPESNNMAYYLKSRDGIKHEYSRFELFEFHHFTLVLQAKAGIPRNSSSLSDYYVILGFQDFDNCYLASFSSQDSDERNGIMKRENGEIKKISKFGQPPTIIDNEYHTIEITKIDSMITVKIDDKEVFTASDSTFGSGLVGLGSYSGSAYFDDITVIGRPGPPGIPGKPMHIDQ